MSLLHRPQARPLRRSHALFSDVDRPRLLAELAPSGVTPAQVDECLGIQRSGAESSAATLNPAGKQRLDSLRGRPLSEILVALGYLDPETASRLPADFHSAPPPPVPVLPGATVVLPDYESRREKLAMRRTFGKYEILRELGRGGMGVVYLARNPDLDAHCAVKVLLAGDDASHESVDRFRREAQAAARLKHPGIVAVYDIGEAEGKTYFAMEYVEGTALDKVLSDPVKAGLAPAPGAGDGPSGLAPRVAMRMVQEIAEAVHAAHEAKVVHRDLKPANVLRDPAGRLKVTDFGLARMVDAGEQATRTGTLMGTPAYMSPEQAEGRVREVDARSDQYQVGAILYELLTGRPPYTGATAMDVVLQVMHEDPPPPRRWNQRIDRDAETICLKAMAREKVRRYESARELAEDCGRYLDGEAILARPEAWWEKGVRWARRRKTLTGLVAALVAVSAIAGGSAWQAQSAQRERERERASREAAEREQARLGAQVRADLRSKAAFYVDGSLDLRRQGLSMKRAESEYLPELRRAVEAAERADPGRAEPRYHLGRLYRSLMRTQEAKAEQELALRMEPTFAPSRYEHGILCARLLEVRLTDLRAQWLAKEGARLAASGKLNEAGSDALPPRPDPQTLAATDPEALVLLAALREDLERVVSTPDSASNSALPAGRLHCARGVLSLHSAGAVRSDPAREFEAAIEAEPNLEEAYEGMASLHLAEGRFGEAVAVLSRGLEVDRGFVTYSYRRGDARMEWAKQIAARGADPRALFEAAIADFARAIELDPAAAAVWVGLGNAKMNWGSHRDDRGEDPSPDYAAALADFDKAILLDPSAVSAWLNRGTVRRNRGLHRKLHGADPSEDYRAALDDYTRAIDLRPALADAWRNRAETRGNWGVWTMERGEDPGEHFAAGIADLEKAMELDPRFAPTWLRRGSTRSNWGNHQLGRGRDPSELYAAALADFEKALELGAASAETWIQRGRLHTNWAAYRSGRGADPSEHFSAALSDFDKAVGINPASAEAWIGRATASSNWGNAKLRRGEDPEKLLVSAIADLDRAIGIQPASSEAWFIRGSSHANLGTCKDLRNEDPLAEYAAAIGDFRKGLEINPGATRAWADMGDMQVNLGMTRKQRGQDPGPDYAAAIDSYGRAIALQPTSVRFRTKRADARLFWAYFKERGGAGAEDLWAAGFEELDRAVSLDPADAEPLWRRGLCHRHYERWNEAVADFEAAIQRDPNCERNIRPDLADARARRSGGGTTPAPAWLTALERAERAIGSGDPVAAREAYAQGLAAFAALAQPDRERSLGDPTTRTALRNANYNFACILSLASAGRGSPGGTPTLVPPAEAVSLRDGAFLHLRGAVDLGWRDRAHLAQDTDLVPLHDDPRWVKLLDSLPR